MQTFPPISVSTATRAWHALESWTVVLLAIAFGAYNSVAAMWTTAALVWIGAIITPTALRLHESRWLNTVGIALALAVVIARFGT